MTLTRFHKQAFGCGLWVNFDELLAVHRHGSMAGNNAHMFGGDNLHVKIVECLNTIRTTALETSAADVATLAIFPLRSSC